MRKEIVGRKRSILAAEAAVTAGMLILLASLFDYRYAMNDDVFIRTIVSGRYSGFSSVHNIQCIILLNGLFALLYRVCGFVPWFGLFVVGSQFFSLYEILTCLVRKMDFHRIYAFLCAAATNVLLWSIMLNEIVIVQYSYTAALLIVSATARLYCAVEKGTPERRNRYWYVGLVIHFLLAFCLRTEIFLFLLPFSVLLTVIRCCNRKEINCRNREFGKWGAFWGVLLLCVGVLYAADYVGYTDEGFREYRKFFDYRTQLYDFLTLPDYEENREFYESADISEGQYALLKNYNFALDEEITSETLKKVVDYANEKRVAQYQGLERLYMRMFTLPLREGLWSYVHRVLGDPVVAADDYPWNLVSVGLYLALLVMTCFTRRARNLVYVFLMFSTRSVLWMYIILKQRTPPRVTHSLFLMEIVCLLLLVFEELSYLEKSGKSSKAGWLYPGTAGLLLAGAGAVAVCSWGGFGNFYRETVDFNREWKALLEYCSEREESFYFMDVYSTVNYSQEIFGEELLRPENYDICGGWLSKSPLCEEKYGHFGFTSPGMALLEGDAVYFVAEQGSDLEWLIGIYGEKGISVSLDYQENVAGRFDIIKLKAAEIDR
ncbi:MAG: hypothetical protein OSJ69_07450 [Acetatifactor sp.]|nr:hypothetical protein [Acetatifactor sp.]